MLGKLFERWASGRHDKELRDFLNRLKAMDGPEIGPVLAIATHQRHTIHDEFGYDLLDPIVLMATNPEAAFRLSSATVQLQKNGDLSAAAGMMVWVHTLRAAARGELRLLGRDMWRELQRGFPYVDEGATDVAMLSARLLNTEGATEFPKGLTPDPI